MCCVYVLCVYQYKQTAEQDILLSLDTLTLAPYDDRTAAVGTDEMPFATRPTDRQRSGIKSFGLRAHVVGSYVDRELWHHCLGARLVPS